MYGLNMYGLASMCHMEQSHSNVNFLFPEGIYEMFCREIFGKKPKTLEFGLQPHKIPDSDTVGQ